MGVAVEAEILAKFEESDVILLAAGSISRVSEVPLDVDLLFGSFGVAQIVLTSDNFHSGATAAVEGGRRRKNITLFPIAIWQKIRLCIKNQEQCATYIHNRIDSLGVVRDVVPPIIYTQQNRQCHYVKQ